MTFMKNITGKIIVTAILTGIVVLSLFLILSATLGTVNMDMTGMIVDPEGNVQETFHLTMHGERNLPWEKDEQLEVYFTFPHSVPYIISENSPLFHFPIFPLEHTNFEFCVGFCYSRQTESFNSAACAIDMESQMLAMKWDGGNGTYLIACADPDTDPKTLFNHFQAFLDYKLWS